MLPVPVRFGLDFGTSNTSLAVWDGERSDVLPLDPIAGAAMPTVLYVRRDGSSSVGRPAIETYLEDNRTRGPIKREYLPLGFKMVSSNPFQKPVDAVILTDVNSPGRLFQALKTFLGDELDVRTNVFGGERCTERLIDDAVAPRLGSRAEWGPKRLHLPAFIVNALHDWHALSALNEKPLLEALDELVKQGAPRRELEALRDAISLQLGYEIFLAADTTKIDLSSVLASILSYHRAAIDVDARLTRR